MLSDSSKPVNNKLACVHWSVHVTEERSSRHITFLLLLIYSGYDGVAEFYPQLLQLIQTSLEQSKNSGLILSDNHTPSAVDPMNCGVTTIVTPPIDSVNVDESIRPKSCPGLRRPGSNGYVRESREKRLSKEERVLNEINDIATPPICDSVLVSAVISQEKH